MNANATNSVTLETLARPIAMRASHDCKYPVYAVTKHDGMVPSSDYFKKQVHSRNVEGYRVVAHGQFAYSTIHLDEGAIGLLDSAEHCIISPMYTVFEVDKERVNPHYLLRLLKSPWALTQYSLMGSGSVHRRRSISFEALGRLRVTLPTLPEQQRIITILDKVDRIGRKRQEATRVADDFLRSVFVDKFGDLESNPKGFPIGSIRDLVATANYGTSEKANEESGRFPILRMGNITYQGGLDLTALKYVDLDAKTQDKYLARKGDLLFNRTNSKELVGKTAVYDLDEPMAIAGYLVRVRMNQLGNPYYVSGYLNSSHGKRTLEARAKSIVGMANINAQEMQDIPILIPPIELQERYAQVVMATRLNAGKFRAFREELQNLESAIAGRYFGGERVSEETLTC